MDCTYGIQYTPANVKASLRPALSISSLAEDVDYVHVYWADLTNTRRCRILPVDYFLHLVKASNRPGVNIAKCGVALVYLHVPDGFSSVGEYLYRIDLSTLRILPSVGFGRVAAVMGVFEEKDGKNSVQVALCPRTTLRRIVELAETKHRSQFLVGFESEFILLKPGSKPSSVDGGAFEPSNIYPWSGTSGFLAGSLEAAILHEISQSIRGSGIPLQMIHPEAAPGQYEVVTGPMPPLQAADALVFTREIIVNVANRHGLRATFAPRPFMYSAGSSSHAHISIHPSDMTAPPKPINDLSNLESFFLAGLLDHLPAVTAFTLPSPASYKRVADGVWSGGTYVSYGTENREAPIRLTNAFSPSSRNFELRFIDGTANPHLALAAIITAGILGISEKKPLQMADCLSKAAAEMSDEERQIGGITKRLPLDTHQARKYLVEDEDLIRLLGRGLVDPFLAVSKKLEEVLGDTNGETELQRIQRIVEFY